MYFNDTHTHIYLPEFDDDRQEMMVRAMEAGVHTTIMPAIDSTTHEGMMALEKEFANCHAMIGLHPCSVDLNYEKELTIISDHFATREFIAVGETGLDFYWDKTFVHQQYEAFHWQIKLAIEKNIPVVIHSRNAIDECIEVVEKYPGVKGVFHCFSGNLQQAQRIIGAGLLLGIGGIVTFKNSGLDKVMEKIGLTNALLETDAPYLAPVPYRGKRNEPSYISLVAEKLSIVCNVTREEVAEITTNNAKRLFGLK